MGVVQFMSSKNLSLNYLEAIRYSHHLLLLLLLFMCYHFCNHTLETDEGNMWMLLASFILLILTCECTGLTQK